MQIFVTTSLLLLLLSVWSGLGLGADNGCDKTPTSKWPLTTDGSSPSPLFLFRGDGRGPDAIRAEGGWLPWAIAERSAKAFGLVNHEKDIKFAKGQRDTVYVSTTTSFDVAARYALINAKNGKETYVYYIHASPNIVDLNRSLGNETRFWWQREFSAMGGIRWSQVVGWLRIDSGFFDAYNYSVPDCGSEHLSNQFFHQHLGQQASHEPFFAHSPDYCRARWMRFAAGGWEPQLAGFAEDEGAFVKENKPLWFRAVEPWKQAQKKSTKQHAYEFMERTKEATGWRGDFPLFRKEEPEAVCNRYVVDRFRA
ncbi:putative heat-labile enterotoxin [Ophiocordyceps polyrhachis-furcata BCC 54312]|uniref:Heat-labile enterotoxin n=1 Tax=Ophiocordyceps polyrhachis-furcata BCC 54312 TaxID=1330021 RepID=A0A367LTD2_9HYPO|nr:putative heat-labile enterotoxin [Ophiocordyceps polyrhachis-furcata BCC 54312]